MQKNYEHPPGDSDQARHFVCPESAKGISRIIKDGTGG